MATLRTRWLLSIFLVNLPNCCASTGPPAPPSNLECFIPCNENGSEEHINCTWDQTPDPEIPTNYSLHWVPASSKEGNVTNVNGSAVIDREKYNSHSDLRVWVQAKNQNGSAKSKDITFNTADIYKPAPPKITKIYQDQLEIYWKFSCCQGAFAKQCDVRHRAAGDQVWQETTAFPGHTLDDAQPGIVYEFQVRCACTIGLSSDWCAIHRMISEKAPVGQLDLWIDCGSSPTSVDCALTWKKLPLSQACGHILRYEVKLLNKTGAWSVNLSTTEPSGQLVCDEMQCYHNSSLKDVLSASVSAHNAHGATRPSNLTIPIRGKEPKEKVIDLKMNKENLTVSWNLPSQLSDKEYVVQYKEAGSPLGQGFDWVRVEKGHTTGIFKGHFKNYTAYQVSLITVSHSGECHRISSVIEYSGQGTPSEVPLFKVDSISATSVTLFWKHVPLLKRRGLILHYEIGGDRQNKVHEVPVSPQHESQTYELQDLTPNQEYEVWIKAVTKAGPGANVTTRFNTKREESFALIIIVLIPCILALICLPVFLSVCRRESKACPLMPSCFYEKVPDPHNSRIFTQMKHQMNDSLAWICISVYEPHPNISLVEIVEIEHKALESSLETTSHPNGLSRPLVGGGSSQIDCQDDQREDAVTEECDRTDHRYGGDQYSKMVDSDEERDNEEEDSDDCLSSSEEDRFMAGYEKHFMPSIQEILEV